MMLLKVANRNNPYRISSRRYQFEGLFTSKVILAHVWRCVCSTWKWFRSELEFYNNLAILIWILSHKIFHVRTMLYTERNVQQFSLKPRGEIYVILLTYSKFKMQHILCMCHSNVHTNIKRIWVLSTRWKWNVHDSLIVSSFNKKHSWILSKVLKYHNKTIWESYIFDLPSHQTWNTWRWKRWKSFSFKWTSRSCSGSRPKIVLG